MAAALFAPGYSERQRNDGAALAPSRVWDHLDRAAVFFQSGVDAGDEEMRSRIANQNISGVDAGGDGMVSLVGVSDGVRRHALLRDPSGVRCETCGQPEARWQMVRGVVPCMADRVCIYLRAAASRKRNSR